MYALVLSYDYPELSMGEALACLEIENIEVKSYKMANRILLVEAGCNDEKIIRAAKRSATIKEAVRIFEVRRDISFDYSSLKTHLKNVKTFGVRVSVFQGNFSRRKLERLIGRKILELYPNLHVNLLNPDIWIRIGILDEIFFIGKRIHISPSKGFYKRSAGKRPFNLASTLKPKLARTLVNLSRARPGSILLDPFSGAGAILIEAEILGVNTIGCELFKKHVYGSKENMNWINFKPIALIRCDSTYLPIRRVDEIVTDPPYGIEAPLGGRSMKEIYEFFLINSQGILKPGGKLVFMHPHKFKLENSIKYGFREIFSCEVPVHGSLTRVIRVWERLAE